MKSAFMLGAAALVASCVLAQDVFAQRGGFREAGSVPLLPDILAVRNYAWSYARGCGGADPPRLIYYPYSDLPYVPVGTPPFYLAGLRRKERQLLGLGWIPVAELLRRILPGILVGMRRRLSLVGRGLVPVLHPTRRMAVGSVHLEDYHERPASGAVFGLECDPHWAGAALVRDQLG